MTIPTDGCLFDICRLSKALLGYLLSVLLLIRAEAGKTFDISAANSLERGDQCKRSQAILNVEKSVGEFLFPSKEILVGGEGISKAHMFLVCTVPMYIGIYLYTIGNYICTYIMASTHMALVFACVTLACTYGTRIW